MGWFYLIAAPEKSVVILPVYQPLSKQQILGLMIFYHLSRKKKALSLSDFAQGIAFFHSFAQVS